MVVVRVVLPYVVFLGLLLISGNTALWVTRLDRKVKSLQARLDQQQQQQQQQQQPKQTFPSEILPRLQQLEEQVRALNTHPPDGGGGGKGGDDFRQTYKVDEGEWSVLKGKRGSFVDTLRIDRYWALQEDPNQHAQVDATEWDTVTGLVARLQLQAEPKWKGRPASHPRYFEGYQYPTPHYCPGSPYECSGHGICETDDRNDLTGRCLCRPPWTGWDCRLPMRNTQSILRVHDKTPPPSDWCTDQTIKDGHTKKWDKRAESACLKKNGMWLGLNDSVTRAAALSFASVLGLRDGDSLFSAGVGCGNLLLEVRREWGPGIHLGGVDFSISGITHTRSVLNGTFCVADIRNMSVVPSESYDFVWTHGVVWYIKTKEVCPVITDLLRIVKSGGTVLIADMADPQHSIPCAMGKSDGGGSHYKIDKLERCIGGMGLKIDYVGMRDVTGGRYDTYCSGELFVALLKKL